MFLYLPVSPRCAVGSAIAAARLIGVARLTQMCDSVADDPQSRKYESAACVSPRRGQLTYRYPIGEQLMS
jgi:hypothetical protein